MNLKETMEEYVGREGLKGGKEERERRNVVIILYSQKHISA